MSKLTTSSEIGAFLASTTTAPARHALGVDVPTTLTFIIDDSDYVKGFALTTIPDDFVAEIVGDSSSFKGLNIGSGVTSIGENAFEDCTSFSGNLLIPDSVTSIGSRAFYNCNGFTGSLELNDLISVGERAFRDLKSMTGSLVVNNVNFIGDGAFIGCGFNSITINPALSVIPEDCFYQSRNLTDITGILKEGVTVIGNEAFDNCKWLTGDLVIPNSVVKIDVDAFEGAGFNGSTLTLSTNPGLTVIDRYAFNGCSFIGTLNIPSNIREIGYAAFRDCGFTTLVLNEGLEEIDGSFQNCTTLSGSLVLPSTLHTLGYGSFQNTNFTGELDLLNVTYIGAYAFDGCSSLTGTLDISSFGSSYIGDGAFSNCGFTSAILPPEWTEIPSSFAKGWTNLTSMELYTNILTPSITRINGAAFEDCSNLTGTLDISSFGSGYIGQSAFARCGFDSAILPPEWTEIPSSFAKGWTNLTDIDNVLNENITSIGSYAFEGCSNLNGTLDISLFGSGYIGDGAFSNCGFSGAILPEEWTSIPNYFAKDWTNLTDINDVINENITSIGAYAFTGCSSLSGTLDLTPFEIGGSVGIGQSAFSRCGFDSAILPTIWTDIPNRFARGWTNLTDIDNVLNENITSIGSYAFEGCSNLNGTLDISSFGATYAIGYKAFSNCGFSGAILPSEWTIIPGSFAQGWTNLTDIDNVLNENITSISSYAFDGCSNLTGTLDISSFVSGYIGQSAFSRCGFSGAILPSEWTSIPDYFARGWTNLTDIDNVLNENITGIGYQAFKGCTNLIKAWLPESIEYIGSDAFAGCTSLTTLYVECDAPTSGYGDQLFGSGYYGDTLAAVETIYYAPYTKGWSDNVWGKGDRAQRQRIDVLPWPNYAEIEITYNDERVETVVERFIPSYFRSNNGEIVGLELNYGIKTIGYSAFAECSNITGELVIPNSVTYIGDYAFTRNGFTGNLIISNSVTYIGDYAFDNCVFFTGNLVIPDSVTHIGHGAFSSCSGFTGDLIIPDSVTYIGSRAFGYCPNIGDVYVNMPFGDFNSDKLEGSNRPNSKLYVHPDYFDGYGPTHGSREVVLWDTYPLPVT